MTDEALSEAAETQSVPTEAVDPALEEFLDQFPEQTAPLVPVEAEEKGCLRCQGPMQFLGTRSFDRGYQPDLTSLAIHALFSEEPTRVYACTVCGRIELYRTLR